MDILLTSIRMDWPVLLPIFICSLLTVAVAINRFYFYSANKRDVVAFIPKLQRELARNNFDGAQNLSVQLGGVIGEVSEEAVRIFNEQRSGFSRSFDIAASLATRKLEKNLTVLGTIGGVAPFLNTNIGLGYIKTENNLKIGDTIQIMVRNKLYDAKISKKNFIEKHNKGN